MYSIWIRVGRISRTTAVFLESLKFCRSFFVENLVFGYFLILFFEITWKNFWRPYYYYLFLNTCAYVLALEKACPRKGCLWPRIFFCVLGLEPCALDYISIPCPLKPNFERLSPLSHINFYINFIQSTPGNTIDGAWCVACRYMLSSQIVKRFDCANNAYLSDAISHSTTIFSAFNPFRKNNTHFIKPIIVLTPPPKRFALTPCN